MGRQISRRGTRLCSATAAALLALSASLLAAPGALAGSVTFTYTGAPQQWTVPSGVNEITVDAYGAQGGAQGGARGGRVTATLPVVQNNPIEIVVGGGGTYGTDANDGAGYNGGGPAAHGWGAGAGGGATDVRTGGCAATLSCTLSARKVVAGGGGGGEQCGYGNPGVGGQNGADGFTLSAASGQGGKGGTQSAGGAGGAPGQQAAGDPGLYATAGTSGSAGQGGTGGRGQNNSQGGCGGGGGGGGYYGGGGGGGAGATNTFYGGGGGGGSSYAPDGATFQAGAGDANMFLGANGKVIISWGQVCSGITSTSSANPSNPGQSVTYTAQVLGCGPGTPTGTVSFTRDGVALPGCTAVPLPASGTATCTDAPGAGDFTIGAVYSGDGAFQPATTADFQHVHWQQAAIAPAAPPGFGSLLIGTASAPVRFTISEIAGHPLKVTSVTAGGDFAVTGDTCSGATVLSYSSCTVDVVFTPTAAGDRTATLHVVSDSVTGALDVPLSGVGTAPPPAAGGGGGSTSATGTTPTATAAAATSGASAGGGSGPVGATALAKALVFRLLGNQAQLLTDKFDVNVLVGCGPLACDATVTGTIKVPGSAKAWSFRTGRASIAAGKLARLRIGSSKAMRRAARAYLKASSKHRLTVVMKVVAVARDGTRVTRSVSVPVRMLKR